MAKAVFMGIARSLIRKRLTKAWHCQQCGHLPGIRKNHCDYNFHETYRIACPNLCAALEYEIPLSVTDNVVFVLFTELNKLVDRWDSRNNFMEGLA